jgi:protein MpaA
VFSVIARQIRFAAISIAGSLMSLSALGYAATPASAPNAPAALTATPAHPSKATSAPVIDWCGRFAQRLPSVTNADCQRIALTPSGGTSVNGFPLLVKHVTPKSGEIKSTPSAAAQPIRIMLLGGIHGDEMTASAIVFQWMQWMQSAPAQNFEWMVAPLVNPDGMLAATPTRVNAHGVDLNRNFPTPGWQRDAPHYWNKVTGSDPRRFPGAAPLSEPETRWLNEQMERFKPEVVISVHAPYGVLDFDGPAPTPRQFGRLIFNPVGVYPGSLGNYSGVHKNVPVITIELPNATAMPADTEVKRIWLDMLAWIQRNVRKGDVSSPVAATLSAHAASKAAPSPH